MDNLGLFLFIFGANSQSEYLDFVMIFGAEYVIYLTLILIFAVAFRGGVSEKKALILTLFSLPVLFIIIKIIHLFFFEARPFVTMDISPLIQHNADASFPSRHGAVMSVIAFAHVIFKSRWAFLFLTLLLWVGISRIYVGVHYPIDILGGFIVGILAIFLSLQIKKILMLRFFR